MKKFISLIVVIAILVLTATSASANAAGQERLSDLSEEECLEFLISKGVSIPNDGDDWGAFAKAIIAKVEEDPGKHFAFGYTYSQNFADAIKAVVNEYYGMEESGVAYIQPRSTYTLQDSTVYGSWSNAYMNYNCYAYAIGRTDWLTPGSLSGKAVTTNTLIAEIANRTKADLKTLGYNCVYSSTTIPSSTVLNGSGKTICVRRDDNYELTSDYHYMKYSNGSWYHKPGNTNPLKYKYTPTTSREWTNEVNYMGVSYEPDRTYDSIIYFITYKSAHTAEYSFSGVLGSEYVHIKVCTSCNEQIEGETSCVFLSGSNRCQGCGVQKSDVSVNRETDTEEIS